MYNFAVLTWLSSIPLFLEYSHISMFSLMIFSVQHIKHERTQTLKKQQRFKSVWNSIVAALIDSRLAYCQFYISIRTHEQAEMV